MMEEPEIVEGVEWTVDWPDAKCTVEDHTPALRDQLAMAALTGLLADGNLDAKWGAFAISSYEIADEMLAAREAK